MLIPRKCIILSFFNFLTPSGYLRSLFGTFFQHEYSMRSTWKVKVLHHSNFFSSNLMIRKRLRELQMKQTSFSDYQAVILPETIKDIEVYGNKWHQTRRLFTLCIFLCISVQVLPCLVTSSLSCWYEILSHQYIADIQLPFPFFAFFCSV